MSQNVITVPYDIVINIISNWRRYSNGHGANNAMNKL